MSGYRRVLLGVFGVVCAWAQSQQPLGVRFDADGTSQLPTAFRKGDWYWTDGSRDHRGDDRHALDWYERGGATEGALAYAVISGAIVVNHTSQMSTYGNTVVLHDDAAQFAFRYAHLQERSPVLPFITRAAAGVTLIGRVGRTTAKGERGDFNPHLHGVLYRNAGDPRGRPCTTVSLDDDTHAARYHFSGCQAGVSNATWHPDGSLLIDGGGTVWLLEDGKRRGVPSMEVLNAHGLNVCQAIRVQQKELANLPEGELLRAPPERRLLLAANGTVFLIVPKGADKLAKRAFASSLAFLGLGYQWDEVEAAQPGELERIPEDENFPVLWAPFTEGTLIQKQGDRAIYVLTNGRKRLIASMEAFTAFGYQLGQVTEIKSELFDSIPESGQGPMGLAEVNPTPSPGGAPAPEPRELITNGDFEDGWRGWQVPSWGGNPSPWLTAQSPVSGRSAACLGNRLSEVESSGHSAFYQWIEIPASAAGSVRLAFWYRGWTSDISTAYDGQVVRLYDSEGVWMRDAMVELEGEDRWKTRAIDLTEYRGRKLAILFDVYQDQAGDPTGMCLDDVSVKVQLDSAPAPTALVRGEVSLHFQPDPVARDPGDGRWRYRVTLKETAGIAVRLERLKVGVNDYSGQISDWFGTTHLAPYGELRANMESWGYQPPHDLTWEFAGSDEKGNSGMVWRRSVRLVD